MDQEIAQNTPPTTSKKERNFPVLELTNQSSLNTTNQPLLVIQSPKTPTLSRKLKAVSLDSDPPKQENTLEVSRDVFSMPNTPKRQIRQKLSCDLDDQHHKSTLAPSFSSNLKKFASNTSISGSQTLKTLPEIMTLQDFGENRTEPVRVKAKGLLERRGSNASLTIDLGSNSSIAEVKPIPLVRLNTAKSVSNLNLSTYGSLDKQCTCDCRYVNPPVIDTAKKPPTAVVTTVTTTTTTTERRKSQEACGNCTIYESVATGRPAACANRCQPSPVAAPVPGAPSPQQASRCGSCKSRRKSLSNENLYVPPCGHCHAGGGGGGPGAAAGANGGAGQQPGCSGQTRHCKGYRKACYPRQPDIESSQLLSEDFKMHLQNIQYLQTAGSVLSTGELQVTCEGQRVPKLHQEFWEVPLNLQEKCYVSGSQSRNRYRGVLPNEHSRVHLPGNQTYIHANYIKGPDYTETSYIATQGPMAHTCEDFWDMIWHTNCTCIVMLTGLIEKGRNKCELYFPLGRKPTNNIGNNGAGNSGGEKSYLAIKTTRVEDRFRFDVNNMQTVTGRLVEQEETVLFEELDEVRHGKHTVRYVRERQVGECTVRELALARTDRSETRTVLHYWYANWPDHKMANPEQVLQIALDVLAHAEVHGRRAVDGKQAQDTSRSGKAGQGGTSEAGSGKTTQGMFDSCPGNTPKIMVQASLDLGKLTTHDDPPPAELKSKKQSTSFDFGSVSSTSNIQSQLRHGTNTNTNRQDHHASVVEKKSSMTTFNFSTEQIQTVTLQGGPRKQSTTFDFAGDQKPKPASIELKESIKRRRSFDQQQKVPVVVHCSAGIGRTGCFLAVLNGIRQLRCNYNVDVLAILCSLRLNRGGMVQTAEQYELIHRVLSLYAESM